MLSKPKKKQFKVLIDAVKQKHGGDIRLFRYKKYRKSNANSKIYKKSELSDTRIQEFVCKRSLVVVKLKQSLQRNHKMFNLFHRFSYHSTKFLVIITINWLKTNIKRLGCFRFDVDATFVRQRQSPSTRIIESSTKEIKNQLQITIIA
jgi:hypothetical protein